MAEWDWFWHTKSGLVGPLFTQDQIFRDSPLEHGQAVVSAEMLTCMTVNRSPMIFEVWPPLLSAQIYSYPLPSTLQLQLDQKC